MIENNSTSFGTTKIMTLQVANNLQYIETVLKTISSIAQLFSMPSKDIVKLCMSTEEAIVNVITYAFSPEETAFFNVEIAISGLDLIVTIHDKGKPYDFSSLSPDDDSWTGLGVKMMRCLTDKVEFKNLGFQGRSQSLYKRLIELPNYTQRVHEESLSMPEHIDFDIHPLKEEEAIEVAQCIYDEFGYTYLSEMVYYPQQFYEACQRGEVYSIVATAKNGEVAGHLALMISKDFQGVAEMGIGVVKRKFRKYAIMQHLTEMILHHAQHVLKLTGLFAQPVVYHTITQKMCNNYGLIPCSFALHYLNDEFSPTFDCGKNRLDVACAMLPFVNEQKDIYLPDEVIPMISEIIQNMKLPRKILKGKLPDTSQKSVGTFTINQRMRLGKCFIEKAGSDRVKKLKDIMLSLKREKCAVAEFYINLSDPGAPYAYQTAKKFNFFCTGIIPQSIKGDYLVMECLMNDIVDYETIKTIEPFTRLLEHIRKFDPNEH